MTKDLNALRLLEKDERLLIVASLRKQMDNFEGNLVFKPLDLANQPSAINQFIRSPLLDTESALIPDELSHSVDSDLDDLLYENSHSINATAPTPQDIDMMCVAPVISSHQNEDRILGFRASIALRPKDRTFIMLLDNFLRRLV